ncbi:stimulator of interferon genes protein [Lingula anatina]|uniref:Stimulator of interferon genes protein n=1 Tax=Lingula anatina TaxID=7574 RepID=A0A1S3KHL2_LINAN|nr:stimulator of interferon genes protein [Lingula anatina]|eukprot:XP_013421964.1 stimulator of interferon genes protein [Lingula anatina]
MTAAASEIKNSMGYGLAWSYYYGYLKLILPGLADRVKTSTFWDASNQRIAPKLFILLPTSCFAHPTLTDGDSAVQPGAHLREFKANRSGNPQRVYRNFVYKVTSEDGQDYYCVAEYATPLLTLFEMEEDTLADLSKEEKLKQRAIFKSTLLDILTRPGVKECQDACVLLDVDDAPNSATSLSQLLLQAIQRELEN